MSTGDADPQQAASDVAEDEEHALEVQLLQIAASGDGAAVAALLERGAEPACETDDGVTPLMLAAEAGSTEAVHALLEAGAPWHAQDRKGHTAGEYASGSGRREVVRQLLDWAVKAELILGTISRRESRGAVPNRDYLGSSIKYEGGRLVDEQGEGVMMDWETPLMRRHAEIICRGGGDVLNVGFGMGIIDGFIQEHKPRSHTIIEAHPDVYAFACSQGWDKRPGVRLVQGRWQDVIDQLGPFDGVFFDTYGEYYEDMHDLHLRLPRLLRPGGVYSFFNGLAPDNMFFHLVYGEIARRELSRLGLETSYEPVPMDMSAKEVWEGVANRYWHLPVYFVPTCIMAGGASDERQQAQQQVQAAEQRPEQQAIGEQQGTAAAAEGGS
ncbi:hypothetical protein ABPG75_011776 [Micractinium tetrahymenae]